MTKNNMSEEHIKCSSIIKNTHLELRRLAAKYGPEDAWKVHCSKKELLEIYADAMHNLAVQHWSIAADANSRCRIQWIQSSAYCYFYGNDLKNIRLKELQLCEKFSINSNKFSEKYNTEYHTIDVLDVGSCYNPFATCNFMNVLPIDLSPAVPNVHKCDFLNVSIGPQNRIYENTVKELKQNSFDLVIFCLLLEYLPSSNQRLKCCSKAYSLLNHEGILAIITPDSKHVGANAKIIKNWRYILALMGFSRIKYEKLPSLHCMLFRKSISSDITKRWAQLHREPYMNEEFNIPQDFHDFSEENDSPEIVSPLITNDTLEIINMFNELPDTDI